MSHITVTLKNSSGIKILESRETPPRIVSTAVGWEEYSVIPYYDGGDEEKFDFWAVAVWSEAGHTSRYCAEDVVDEIGRMIYRCNGKTEVME